MKQNIIHQIKTYSGECIKIDSTDFDYASKFKWYLNTGGYAERVEWKNGKTKHIPLHREVIRAGASVLIDHKNGDKLDNRRSNLRLCSHAENIRNQKMKNINTSGFKGVFLHTQNRNWRAQIKLNYKSIHLGCFDNKVDAARAYNAAAINYFGEFANLNKV